MVVLDLCSDSGGDGVEGGGCGNTSLLVVKEEEGAEESFVL